MPFVNLISFVVPQWNVLFDQVFQLSNPGAGEAFNSSNISLAAPDIYVMHGIASSVQ